MSLTQTQKEYLRLALTGLFTAATAYTAYEGSFKAREVHDGELAQHLNPLDYRSQTQAAIRSLNETLLPALVASGVNCALQPTPRAKQVAQAGFGLSLLAAFSGSVTAFPSPGYMYFLLRPIVPPALAVLNIGVSNLPSPFVAFQEFCGLIINGIDDEYGNFGITTDILNWSWSNTSYAANQFLGSFITPIIAIILIAKAFQASRSQ